MLKTRDIPPTDHLLQFLTMEEMNQFRGIIVHNLLAFVSDKYDLGCTHLIEHKTDLVEGAKPHKETLRRLNPEKQRQADEQVQALLELGVIEPAQSPWASGIVMAKKKEPGVLRMCIDFRMLNELTVGDAYPLPRIDDTVTGLGSARVFTSIDISNAFWQIITRKADGYKTAFATKKGLYQWTRMPFGLCNATATFQRLMNMVLRDIKQEYGNVVLCYVDDILIATTTVEQHLEKLDQVFQCLAAAGLKCKPAKCSFMKGKINLLGRVIGEGEVRPDHQMYKALADWQEPRTKKELQSFLSFVNYYREFIQELADKTFSLKEITKPSKVFQWTEEHAKCFTEVRVACCTNQVKTGTISWIPMLPRWPSLAYSVSSK